MSKLNLYWLLFMLVFAMSCSEGKHKETPKAKLKTLIIDGQNNHYVWPKTSRMMANYLEQTALFEVYFKHTDTLWLGIKYNPNRAGTLRKYIHEFPVDSAEQFIAAEPPEKSNFTIDFSPYDLVVLNLGLMAAEWPENTKRNFEEYMEQGAVCLWYTRPITPGESGMHTTK